MSTPQLAVLVLAAGQGTRMNSALPKVMHRLANRPLIEHVFTAARPLAPERLIVVVGPGMEEVAATVERPISALVIPMMPARSRSTSTCSVG